VTEVSLVAVCEVVRGVPTAVELSNRRVAGKTCRKAGAPVLNIRFPIEGRKSDIFFLTDCGEMIAVLVATLLDFQRHIRLAARGEANPISAVFFHANGLQGLLNRNDTQKTLPHIIKTLN
jgi:hypothetical protein